MIKYNTLEQLIKENSLQFYTNYIKQEITSHLGCNGSDIVKNENDEPNCIFEFEVNKMKYKIGVTALEIEDDEYRYFYWLTS